MSFYYELFKEINLARRDPAAFGDKILSYKPYFKGNVMKLPGQKSGTITQEGFKAFEETASYLKSLSPVEELSPSKALGRIANDYFEKISHCDPEKIDEIDINAIINKYGTYYGTFENGMDFGSSTPELVVISLLVSDGDETRSNREFVLNPEIKKVGVASGKHDTYGYLTIIVSCTNFKNTFDKDDTETYGGLMDNYNSTKDDDEFKIDDPNVTSCSKRERIVIDSGKRKKKITLVKKYKDGKIKKEVKYVNL